MGWSDWMWWFRLAKAILEYLIGVDPKSDVGQRLNGKKD